MVFPIGGYHGDVVAWQRFGCGLCLEAAKIAARPEPHSACKSLYHGHAQCWTGEYAFLPSLLSSFLP